MTLMKKFSRSPLYISTKVSTALYPHIRQYSETHDPIKKRILLVSRQRSQRMWFHTQRASSAVEHMSLAHITEIERERVEGRRRYLGRGDVARVPKEYIYIHTHTWGGRRKGRKTRAAHFETRIIRRLWARFGLHPLYPLYSSLWPLNYPPSWLDKPLLGGEAERIAEPLVKDNPVFSKVFPLSHSHSLCVYI